MAAKAFPGAEGFGAATRGAFGGSIPPVTFLVDDPSLDSGSGSWREAVQYPNPALVIVRGSGTCINRSTIRIQPWKTISFQTSTGGWQFAGEETQFRGHDIICRFGRFRSGDKIVPALGWDNRDAVNFGGPAGGAMDCILDHCDIGWSVDESFTPWFGSKRITLQDSIIHQPLHSPLHPKGPHSMALDVGNGSGDVDILRTMIFGADQRGPQFDSTTGLCRFVNSWNVGWQTKAMELEGTVGNVDVINSGFKRGPDSSKGFSPTGIAVKDSATLATLRLYLSGNVDPTIPDPNMDNWSMVRNPAGHTVPEGSNRVFSPHDGPPLTIVSAAQAFAKIIEQGGSSRPFRDPVSKRVVWMAKNACVKRASTWMLRSTDDLPQYQSFPIAAWPVLTGPPPPLDSNNDGIPDQWCVDHGLDPNDNSIALQVSDDGEYRWIERYLNDPALVGGPP